MRQFQLDQTIDADVASVWRHLDDSSSWPTWTPIDSFEAVEPAGSDGLGEIRRFHNGRHTVTEQIVERIPLQRLAYTFLSGLAVRDYLAAIDLSRVGDDTRLRWRTSFRVKVPGTGWLYERTLRAATRGFIAGLAAAVSKPPSASGDRTTSGEPGSTGVPGSDSRTPRADARLRALRMLATATGAACTGIGIMHAILGARSVVGLTDTGATEDSQERFYGSIFAGYGIAWLYAARQQPVSPQTVRWLAATMAAGGGSRLLGLLRSGRPHPFWLVMTGVEFVVPAGALWLLDTTAPEQQPATPYSGITAAT